MNKRISLINPSFFVFCTEMQEAFERGYRIDHENPPVTWGIVYECGMIMEDDKPIFRKPDEPLSGTPAQEAVFVIPDVAAPRKAGRPRKDAA